MKPIDREEVERRMRANTAYSNQGLMSVHNAIDVALALLAEARASERADAVKMLRLFVDADSLEDSEMYQEAMEKARAAIAAATEGGDAR